MTGRAGAQTGPDLLIKQFPKGEHVETQGTASFYEDGHTNRASEFQLSTYDVSGRVRLFPAERADPRFGYEMNYLNIKTNDPALPSKFVDTSVAVAMGVADVDGWLAGLSLGIGYSGAGAFDDGDGYYGKADFAIGKQLDPNTSIGIVLDYNGNRSLYPDFPIIGFEYRKKIEDKLVMAVGFPYSEVVYKPTDQLSLSAKFIFPDGVDANVDFSVSQHFGVFTSFMMRWLPYHYDALPNNADRVIFEDRRLEAGVRWSPVDQVDLTGAIGYAFSQEFNVGFDTRDEDRLAKPNDVPYLRFGVDVKF